MSQIGSVSIFEINASLRHEWMSVVEAFVAAHHRCDFTAIRVLLEKHGLHVFYHLEIHQFTRILDDAVEQNVTVGDAANAFHLFVQGASSRRFLDTHVLDALVRQNRAFQVAYMFDLRLQGRPREALEYSRRTLSDFAVIQPFIDAHDGWPQFAALQRGTTAMLAGETDEAMLQFEEVQLRATTPGLEFFLRDALVKHALIHAAFGDPAEAETLLNRANAVHRSSSWAEAAIDVSSSLVEVMLEPDPSTARVLLRCLDVSNIGEMWPFYAHAEYRVLDNSGAFSVATRRLEQLDALPFPRVDGQGYTGSVIPLAMALNSIAIGTPALAKRHLERVDSNFALTGIVRSLLEMQVGALPKAIALTVSLRDATRNLRRLELWRLSILADAHLTRGDTLLAIEVLRESEELQGSLSLLETKYFSQDLRKLGEMNVTGWPKEETADQAYMDQLLRSEGHLSERELEIVRALTRDVPRRELAESLFVSQNTLKTQLRSVFRKLGATSREEVLIEAAKRGLL